MIDSLIGMTPVMTWTFLNYPRSRCLFVCLSERITQKLLLRLPWFIYSRSIIPVAQSSSKINGFGSGLNHLLNNSSPLRDRKKYAMNVCHDVKRASQEKMPTQVHPSERWSAIFDCLVVSSATVREISECVFIYLCFTPLPVLSAVPQDPSVSHGRDVSHARPRVWRKHDRSTTTSADASGRGRHWCCLLWM